MTNEPILKVFRMNSSAKIPVYSTNASACFDIFANIPDKTQVKIYNIPNKSLLVTATKNELVLKAGDRALIPTGLLLDIPTGHSIRLHSRSSVALKRGLTLANNEAVIDEDYVDEVFVLLTNTTKYPVTIEHQERIVQGELVKTLGCSFEEIDEPPQQKGDRTGGLGSTGTK